MTLEPTKEAKPQKTKKVTKYAQARALALKYKDLRYDMARTKIMEEVPCSKSVAHRAIRYLEAEEKKEKGEKPSITIQKQEEKKPEYIEEIQPTQEKVEPTPQKIEEITPIAQEQLDYFRDMLRGVHVLVVSKDGILGKKYGRETKQCTQVSDQLYRWLCRRVGVEDLERYDTILLGLSYLTLIGSIGKDVLDERRKKEAQEKKEKRAK